MFSNLQKKTPDFDYKKLPCTGFFLLIIKSGLLLGGDISDMVIQKNVQNYKSLYFKIMNNDKSFSAC